MKPSIQRTLRLIQSKHLAACTAAALLAPIAQAVPIFEPASPVAAFNTASFNDQVTDLSPDGLTAILQSDRTGRSRNYSSTRPTITDPWSAPSNADFSATNSITNVGHGVLSPDGLSLFYQDNPIIKQATRATPSLPFSAGTAVPELNIGVAERPGKLSANGLRMYLEIFDGTDTNLFVADRPSISDPWSTPTQGPFAANVNTADLEFEPFVTSDELQLYFASTRLGGVGGIDIWWANRASVADPFSAPENVSTVNTLNSDRSPELFGSTLFFTSSRLGTNDVFSAAVPEPGSLALLLAAGVGALLHRRRGN